MDAEIIPIRPAPGAACAFDEPAGRCASLLTETFGPDIAPPAAAPLGDGRAAFSRRDHALIEALLDLGERLAESTASLFVFVVLVIFVTLATVIALVGYLYVRTVTP